ncbi:Pentatricopeptide repeat-containing protein [Ananas comosus]|uniref:Pentatricopeptide repeat-containing protein n=1 Tax=Ananas comosus TaxID=4615 RepID=A0A199UHP9_ANACO|nr:Pentatricopeptide repeat-containing protein [Ananas comosus]
MITAFAKSSTPEKALELFFVMSSEGLSLTETTFTSVLNACSGLCVPEFGKIIHAKAVKRNLHTSAFGGSSLIDFYGKCSLRNDARKAFDEISEKNIVSWNSLLNVYSDEDSCASLGVLKETLCFGFKPNEISFSSVLRTASCLVLRQLHSLVIRMGYDNNDYVSSAIIASYASNGNDSDALACGSALDSQLSVVATNAIAGIYNRSSRFQESKELLLRLETPDVVSWNVLLTACARNGDYAQAFDLFNHMRTLGHSVDKYTATSLLSICSKINNLSMGKSLHGLLVKTNAGSSDTLVHNILLDMYVKCGSLECCVKVFDEMDERNLISWTAVISGLGLHGRPHEALIWFKRMEEEGFVPDNVALLAVLSACRHGGLVEEGLRLFECMKAKYRVEPEMDHYVCVVDLLCKYGRLREAELVIDEMPFQPNAVIWRMFLQGCKRYGVEAIGG